MGDRQGEVAGHLDVPGIEDRDAVIAGRIGRSGIGHIDRRCVGFELLGARRVPPP